MSEDGVRPEDALQVAQRALGKVNDLQEDNEDLRDRVTALELRYQEYDRDRSYEDLDTDGHVGRVREQAFERATDGHGKASLDYNDIKWGVFDGQPSAHYCYKLMRIAGKATGFTFKDPDGKGKALLVDAGRARRGASFSTANKTISEGGRSG